MAVAFLKERSLGRVLAGHPWVFAADLLRIEKPPEDGGEITVRTANGSYVGNGFYNSKSSIPIRIFSRSREKLDEAFFQKRLFDAKERREKTLSSFSSGIEHRTPDVYRLIWSEADFLPGLVVDRYDDAWVVQTLTLAMEQRKGLIVDLVKDSFRAKVIIERNDVASRQFEGLSLQKSILLGEGDGKRAVTLGRVRMEVDLLGGQKTGAYLDQVENQMLIGGLAGNRRVLDCFTYHGGFAIHAALGGASKVEALEISREAVIACRHNAELNGMTCIQWKVTNVFDELKARQKTGEKFDLIVLDPPSFTKSRSKLKEALGGYKEINLRALKLLSCGGLLATFCCSHHVDIGTFRAVVMDAAFDVRRILRQHGVFSQPSDHPVIPSIPETEYLKGFLFEVV